MRRWGITAKNQMRRLLSVLAFCFVIIETYAEFPRFAGDCDEVRDVMNAYLYNEYCRRWMIPLFRPEIGSTSHLKVSEFQVGTYYGEYVKDSEYPTKTYDAYYNEYGYLYKIEYENKEYFLSYDDCGILDGFKCYDKKTGQLAEQKDIKPEYDVCKSEYVEMTWNSKDEWWKISGWWGEFKMDNTLVLGVPYKDGFWAYYHFALRQNKMGEKMKVMREGSMYFSAKELKEKNRNWDWKHESESEIAKYVMFNKYAGYVNFGIDRRSKGEYCYEYNEVGLNDKYGMTLSECLSHGVRDDVWYEYEWISSSAKISKNTTKERTIPNGYVDLGLPSGTLWKDHNEDGYLTYDEAIKLYKKNLPTREQWEELLTYCEWTWSGWKVNNDNEGYTIKGRNGNTIFLPNLGTRYAKHNFERYGYGQSGDYWSSSLSEKNNPYCLSTYRTYHGSNHQLDEDKIDVYEKSEKADGLSVRLVY